MQFISLKSYFVNLLLYFLTRKSGGIKQSALQYFAQEAPLIAVTSREVPNKLSRLGIS